MILQIECKRCGRKHYPKTLMRRLLCCSTTRGPRRLVSVFRDPMSGATWYVPSNAAIVRVFRGKKLPERSWWEESEG